MLISSLSAYLLTGPRVISAMAHAGQFPAVAGRLTERQRTPAVATRLQAAWARPALDRVVREHRPLRERRPGPLRHADDRAIFVLRRSHPEWPRPFRTPGYPFVPALFLLATAALTAAAFTQRPRESGLSLASILLGVPFYYAWRHATRAC